MSIEIAALIVLVLKMKKLKMIISTGRIDAVWVKIDEKLLRLASLLLDVLRYCPARCWLTVAQMSSPEQRRAVQMRSLTTRYTERELVDRANAASMSRLYCVCGLISILFVAGR